MKRKAVAIPEVPKWVPQLSPTKVDHAKLPARYLKAKQALALASTIDEVKGWGDREAAVYTYARLARDETLMKHARRIQARYARRLGELLKRIPVTTARERRKSIREPAPRRRFQIAREAGLTPSQVSQAIHIADGLNEAEFARVVDSDHPPSLTQLDKLGIRRTYTRNNPGDTLIDRRRCMAALERFYAFAQNNPPEEMRAAFAEPEHDGVSAERMAARLQQWLKDFRVATGMTVTSEQWLKAFQQSVVSEVPATHE